jgi:hypothetical protein
MLRFPCPRLILLHRAFLVLPLCAALLPPAALADGPWRALALSGQQAPGAPAGTAFLAFGSPYDHGIPVPQVDDGGGVLFFAYLTGPGVTTTNGHGLWVWDGTLTRLLARAGDPAPGTGSGVFFLGLPNDIVPLGFDREAGLSAVPATLRGDGVDFFNDDGLWSGDASGLQLLLREGDPAPGTGGALYSPYNVDFSAAGALVLSRLRGPGIDDDNDESVWSHRDGALIFHAREGDPAPGTDALFGRGHIGARPATFGYGEINDAGEMVVRGDLLGQGVDSYNDEALFVDRGSGLELYLREGDRAPGAGKKVTFGGSSVSLLLDYPTINAQGEIAFLVRLGGKHQPALLSIYSDHLGSLLPVARIGDPAPGTGAEWTALGWPHLCDGSHIAFLASIQTGSYPLHGAFWDQPGTVVPLLLPGDPVPDRPGLTLFQATQIVGYAAGGHLVFRGHIGVPSQPVVTALIAAAPDGTLHTLVAGGDTIDVSSGGGDLREVASVSSGELSADGTVAVRLTFADGSSGVFTFDVLEGTS